MTRPFSSNLRELDKPHNIILPGRSLKNVTTNGNIQLLPSFHLIYLLYIPSFKFNLLSVSKLTNTSSYNFTFLSYKWLLQDQKTNTTILTVRVINNLYVLCSSLYLVYQNSSIKNSSLYANIIYFHVKNVLLLTLL